jgi:hypothetical protein
MIKRKTVKLILLSMGVFVLCMALNAQIGNKYSFMEATANWQPISGSYATGAMTDEGLATPVDIGFTFPYGANTYTQVKISSNGWMGLGTNLNLPYYANDLATLNIRPLLAPLWDDLDLTYGAVQHGTYGVAPHRIFVVQWLAARWNFTAANEFNFMTRLHETGQVDFIYGPHLGSPVNASASIGINMTPGGSGYYYSILPGMPAQAFSNQQYQNLQVSLSAGTLYLFAPKTTVSQNASAVNLTGSLTPMHNVETEFLAAFGNAGTEFMQPISFTGYLMRGEEVLATVSVPTMMPGSFNIVPIPWTPDTTGVMQLYINSALPDDPDSLNNTSYPLTINVQPYVGNNDQTASPAISRLSCYPNPFTVETTISYSVKELIPIKLEIYNLKGQKLKRIFTGNKTQGSCTAKWNGTDDKGRPVPQGIYLCKLSSDKDYLIRKLILLK